MAPEPAYSQCLHANCSHDEVHQTKELAKIIGESIISMHAVSALTCQEYIHYTVCMGFRQWRHRTGTYQAIMLHMYATLCYKEIHMSFLVICLALVVNHGIQKGTYAKVMYIGFSKNMFFGHLALFHVTLL